MTAATATEAFVDVAKRYCAFVQTASGVALQDRLRLAAALLAELYLRALALPAADPTDDEDAAAGAVAVPADWPGFGELDGYWEVFDPYQLEEPVAGSLTDDVLDVYRDIRRGLALYDAARVADALWEWRFHRRVHWGDHAVDALRALQRAINASDG